MQVRGFLYVASLVAALPLLAQPAVRLPEVSPAATVGETIGVTDVRIDYHRPAVNNRKIWGGLVPYGVLWRAGANENTTISFSTPVKVEGLALPAGTYGLFMIPGESQWTVVFSRFAGDWGTYNYDPAEDAGRVMVAPKVSTDHERLFYTFDDVTTDSATVSVRWEKLKVPFKIQVDLVTTVRASIREELRGGKHWRSDSWAAAARWELRNGDPSTALEYANRALDLGTTSAALRTKAAVLEKKGDARGAAELRERAKSIANEAELMGITAGASMNAKKYDEAIAYLSGYVTAHPDSPQLWRAWAGLGEAWAAKGDMAKAREAFDKGMAAAHDMAERTEVQDSINSVGAEGK